MRHHVHVGTRNTAVEKKRKKKLSAHRAYGLVERDFLKNNKMSKHSAGDGKRYEEKHKTGKQRRLKG